MNLYRQKGVACTAALCDYCVGFPSACVYEFGDETSSTGAGGGWGVGASFLVLTASAPRSLSRPSTAVVSPMEPLVSTTKSTAELSSCVRAYIHM